MNVVISLTETKNNIDEICQQLQQLVFVEKVEIAERKSKTGGLWVFFHITTNVEFISDEQDEVVFDLLINSCLEARKKGQRVYYKHRFVGVIKYFFQNQEYNTWSEAYKEAASYLRRYGLVQKAEDLVELREI